MDESTVVETQETPAVDTAEETIPEMTEAQERAFLNAALSGDEMKAQKAFEKVMTRDTEKQETPGEEPVSPAEEPVQEEPDTIESLRESRRKAEERHQNLERKLAEQGRELGELRKRVQQPVPLPQYIPPPPPVQRPGTVFDFTDPNSIKQVALEAYQEAERGRAQVEFESRFQGGFQSNRSEVLQKHQTSDEDVDAAVSQLWKDMFSGRIPEIAYRHSHMDAIIQEAEKRGEQNAIKKLQTAQSAPRRAVGISSQSATESYKDLNTMSFEELRAEADKYPPSHPRHDEIGRFILSRSR